MMAVRGLSCAKVWSGPAISRPRRMGRFGSLREMEFTGSRMENGLHRALKKVCHPTSPTEFSKILTEEFGAPLRADFLYTTRKWIPIRLWRTWMRRTMQRRFHHRERSGWCLLEETDGSRLSQIG